MSTIKTNNLQHTGSADVNLALDSSGYVAIQDGAAGTPALYFSGDSNTGIYSPGADSVAISTGGSARATVDSSGRLLVGTSTNNAGYKLQVVHTDSTGVLLGCFNGGTNYLSTLSSNGSEASKTVVSNGQELFAINVTGYDGSANRTAATISAQVDGTPGANDMPGRLVFSTTADGASSPTERMRISANGALLFGTTNTSLPSATTGIGLYYFPNNALTIAANGGNSCLILNKTDSTTGDTALFRYNGGTVGSITITTTSTAYNTSSDYRLKENVTLLTGATDRLQQIPVHRFNFIADPNKTVDGFLAHEVQAVVPECVTGEKDAVDDDGNPIYQGIDQSKLVPLLTAALQEAVAKIEGLEARLTAAGI